MSARTPNTDATRCRPHGAGSKLTPSIHAQYLAPFPNAGSRERVLWALARALLGRSAFYDNLWRQRERLAALPTLIVWGTCDPAFPPQSLDRWQRSLPSARVARLAESGHWPHEEEPEAVLAARFPGRERAAGRWRHFSVGETCQRATSTRSGGARCS